MNYLKGRIVKLLVDFFEDDFRRIEHALAVLKEAEALLENRSDCDGDVMLAAALLHDVGIKPSERELGYNDGKTQERYGPPVVRELLEKIDFPPSSIQKVAEMVGNHHSPSCYDYPELQVLKEADRIVNRRENSEAGG
jgi:putative nucleotidyltransferase with HDIG domain